MNSPHVLVVYCHPKKDSFVHAIHETVIGTLRRADCTIDECDLYGEEFDPCMDEGERTNYKNTERNRIKIEPYASRIRVATQIIFIFPLWWYSVPARLKGFFDRVIIPGVGFHIHPRKARPNLLKLMRIVVITTIGSTRWVDIRLGLPWRVLFQNGLRKQCAPQARIKWITMYGMDNANDAAKKAFLSRVSKEIAP